MPGVEHPRPELSCESGQDNLGTRRSPVSGGAEGEVSCFSAAHVTGAGGDAGQVVAEVVLITKGRLQPGPLRTGQTGVCSTRDPSERRALKVPAQQRCSGLRYPSRHVIVSAKCVSLHAWEGTACRCVGCWHRTPACPRPRGGSPTPSWVFQVQSSV